MIAEQPALSTRLSRQSEAICPRKLRSLLVVPTNPFSSSSTESSSLLSLSPAAIDLFLLCFHSLTNCFFRKSFNLITIRVARGCHPAPAYFPHVSSVRASNPDSARYNRSLHGRSEERRVGKECRSR